MILSNKGQLSNLSRTLKGISAVLNIEAEEMSVATFAALLEELYEEPERYLTKDLCPKPQLQFQ